MSKHRQKPFTWRHFQADIVRLCVHWSLRDALSYRDLEEILLERDVQASPQSHQRLLVGGRDVHQGEKAMGSLSRAVASEGKTLERYFSSTKAAHAAKRFFLKRFASSTTESQVTNVDKHEDLTEYKHAMTSILR